MFLKTASQKTDTLQAAGTGTTNSSEQWRFRRRCPLKCGWLRENHPPFPPFPGRGDNSCTHYREVFHPLMCRPVIGKSGRHRAPRCSETPGTRSVLTAVSTDNISLTFAQEKCWISSRQQKELSVLLKSAVLISSALAVKCQLNRTKMSPNDLLIEDSLHTTRASERARTGCWLLGVEQWLWLGNYSRLWCWHSLSFWYVNTV